jgi:monothiol glutaredoxin
MYASGALQKLLGVEERPMAAPRVTITPAAARAFRDAAANAGDDVLRLEIDSQYSCDLHFGPKSADDFAVSSSEVALHVGRTSAGRADGITIDFVTEPTGAFTIDNPNAPPRVKPISPKALKALLDKGGVELFDVRPDDERVRASIPQARKLDAQGQKFLFGLEKGAAIALHCHHGVRSRAAAEELLTEGFTNVYNLEGGIEAWSRDVDPSIPRY